MNVCHRQEHNVGADAKTLPPELTTLRRGPKPGFGLSPPCTLTRHRRMLSALSDAVARYTLIRRKSP